MFELMRERAQAARDAPAPPREADLATPWSGAGVTRAERSAATIEEEPRTPGQLRVPMTRVYMAIALALALVVGAWAAGYQLGVRDGKDELERLVGDVSVVTPPRNPAAQTGTEAGTEAGNQSGVQGPGAGSRPASGQRGETSPANPGPGTGAWVLLPDGLRGADPRKAGNNYLELATLSDEQTRDALGFLASKGVRAIGVPVDSGGDRANNPTRYTLYSLGLAVPSGRYRTTTAERRDHERLVANIGAQWRQERDGGSDFSQTLWRRYDP